MRGVRHGGKVYAFPSGNAAIALQNFGSKFNPALAIESQRFCLLPKR
jgi:hypothetical protein